MIDSTLFNSISDIALRLCPRVYSYKYLSDSDETYIELYESEVRETPTKDSISQIGEISITVHFWGDQYSRYEVGELMEKLKKSSEFIICGQLKFRQLKKKTFQTIMGDTSNPKKTFTHGVLILTFNYSN